MTGKEAVIEIANITRMMKSLIKMVNYFKNSGQPPNKRFKNDLKKCKEHTISLLEEITSDNFEGKIMDREIISAISDTLTKLKIVEEKIH